MQELTGGCDLGPSRWGKPDLESKCDSLFLQCPSTCKHGDCKTFDASGSTDAYAVVKVVKFIVLKLLSDTLRGSRFKS